MRFPACLISLGALAVIAAGQSAKSVAGLCFSMTPFPQVVDQWTSRSIVEMVSPSAKVTLPVRYPSGRSTKKQFLRFEVRVVTKDSPDNGKVFPCYTEIDRNSVSTTASKFLLLGWRSAAGGGLNTEAQGLSDRFAHLPVGQIQTTRNPSS